MNPHAAAFAAIVERRNHQRTSNPAPPPSHSVTPSSSSSSSHRRTHPSTPASSHSYAPPPPPPAISSFPSPHFPFFPSSGYLPPQSQQLFYAYNQPPQPLQSTFSGFSPPPPPPRYQPHVSSSSFYPQQPPPLLPTTCMTSSSPALSYNSILRNSGGPSKHYSRHGQANKYLPPAAKEELFCEPCDKDFSNRKAF